MSRFNEKVYAATNRTVAKRDALFDAADLAPLKQAAIEKRRRSLADAEALWQAAAARFSANGVGVTFAADGAAACARVAELIGDRRRVVKGKSLTTEEIELRQFLEARGCTVDETDLGEWIIQQRGELPSHLIVPAIHLSAGQVAALIERRFGVALGEDATAITRFVRGHLRERFRTAEVGIVGANFVIADPPTIGIVSNEGNVSLTARLPALVLVVVGYDRIYDSANGLANVQRLLTASATGQEHTSYLDFVRRPLPHQQVHVLVLDNGRRALIESELGEAARCIRCAACLNSCPVYQEVGGHTFGRVYHGGIGSILTAFTAGPEPASRIATYCLRCSTCSEVCPMQVPVADLVARASRDYPPPFYIRWPLGRLREHRGEQREDEREGRQAVFIGCAFRSRWLRRERRAIEAAVERHLPDAELIADGCCGMPHFYKGLVAESDRRFEQLARTLERFEKVYLPCSSGYAFLRQRLGARIELLSEALIGADAPSGSMPRAYYHTPCHLKSPEGRQERERLATALTLEPWPAGDRCCGSGGTYFVQHPLVSKRILGRKRDLPEDDTPIVTSCPSCLLQLRRLFGRERVMHPARLLASANGEPRHAGEC